MAAGSVAEHEAVARRSVRAKHLTPRLQSRYRVHGAPPLHAPRHVEATRQLFKHVPDRCGSRWCLAFPCVRGKLTERSTPCNGHGTRSSLQHSVPSCCIVLCHVGGCVVSALLRDRYLRFGMIFCTGGCINVCHNTWL